jgi:hypothetical protein
MDFFILFITIAWCLSGWLAYRIGQKLDDNKTYDWQLKLCCLIFGPYLFIMSIMEYLKRKKRAKYTAKEMLNRRKDIYDLWDWLLGINR